jgi:HlyD family secretion protein
MIKVVTIILAIAGMGAGVWAVVTTDRNPPDMPSARPASVNPFNEGIAASGVVEAASRNIQVASPEPGVVSEVLVDVNQTVKAGDPMFRLDGRVLEGELAQAQAAVQLAEAKLKRSEAATREEDLSPLRAAGRQIVPRLKNAQEELARYQQLHSQSAASDAELQEKLCRVEEETAALEKAKAELKRAIAGTWEYDLKIVRSELAQAQAELKLVQSRLDRLTVRSPISGTVLKRYIEPGEYTSGQNGPAFVVGDISTLYVRAMVDERDAAQLREGAQATAVVVDHARHEFKLEMVRIEPLTVPKRHLTGTDTELVDTRVVEVLFRAAPSVRLFPGQLVDTYIEASSAEPEIVAAAGLAQ